MTIPRRWRAFPVPSAYFPRCPRFLRVFRVLALLPSAPRRVRVGPRPQRNATRPQCVVDADRASCGLFAHLYVILTAHQAHPLPALLSYPRARSWSNYITDSLCIAPWNYLHFSTTACPWCYHVLLHSTKDLFPTRSHLGPLLLG